MARWCGPHPLRWRILTDQVRKACFDCRIALAQSVVLGIRYSRGILLVVAFVVGGDFSGQPFELGPGLRRG